MFDDFVPTETQGQDSPQGAPQEEDKGQAPEEGQEKPVESPAENVVEVGGRQYSNMKELAEAYMASVREMNAKQQEAANLRREYEDFKSRYAWAPSYEDFLNQHPDVRTEIEEIIQGRAPREQAPAHAPDIYTQKLFDLERKYEEIRIDKELDNLANKGFPMDAQRRARVYEHLVRTGDKDVEGAYKKLFFEDEIKRAKEEAAKSTGKAMAANQTAYQSPPAGNPSSGKSTKEMSKDEWETALEEEISKLDLPL